MDELEKQSLDAARDTVKQLITLATGVITVTVTFYDKIFSSPSGIAKTLTLAGWSLFLLSIAMGIFSLMALTGAYVELNKRRGESRTDGQKLSISDAGLRWFPALQIVLFFAALIFVVIFGAIGLLG